MIRFAGFLLRLALVVGIILWLAEQPGTARIVWHDTIIETSAAFLSLSIFGLGILFYLMFRFWRFLRYGPERWRLHRRMQKIRRGHDMLNAGLVALAGGHAVEAGRLAVNARKLLGTSTAMQWLQAQAALQAGDTHAAKEIYTALAADKDSAVLGYRGLIAIARRNEDWQDVDQLIEKLHSIQPDTPWLHSARFEVLARRQDWDGATDALAKIATTRLTNPEKNRQQRAVIFAASSQSAARRGQLDRALQDAEQAVRWAPDWLPALILLAEQQARSGITRATRRTVEKNWAQHPHPQLASLYRETFEDAAEAIKHVQKLCRANPDAFESRMAMAEAALAADIWGEARRYLIGLVSSGQATQGVYKLLARLERRESGDEQAAMQWMIKASDAPTDAAWQCCSCGAHHAEWLATCDTCGSFDSVQWQVSKSAHGNVRQPRIPHDDYF